LLDEGGVVSEGTMELAKTDRFRFETDAMIMVSDGLTLWRYSHHGNPPTVIVEPLGDAEQGLVPSEILFKYPRKFEIETVKEGALSGRPVYILDMIPKKRDLGVRSVRVWVDASDALTRKMIVVDEANNQTTFTLQDIELNVPIPDERFKLKIPDDVKVYDLR
jgi:outer membrane lipoprotein-sorting protein